jgi:hypothetical protein
MTWQNRVHLLLTWGFFFLHHLLLSCHDCASLLPSEEADGQFSKKFTISGSVSKMFGSNSAADKLSCTTASGSGGGAARAGAGVEVEVEAEAGAGAWVAAGVDWLVVVEAEDEVLRAISIAGLMLAFACGTGGTFVSGGGW